MIDKILLVSLLILFTACGSLDWSFFSDKKKGDKDSEVAKEFNLSEDVIVKFQEKKPVQEAEKSKEDKTKENKASSKKLSTKKAQKEAIVANKKSTLADDYPENLKTLSKNSLKYWQSLNLDLFQRSGEKMFFEADYAGITMGKMVVSNEGIKDFPVGKVSMLKADIKTSPFYKYLYELEGTVSSHFLLDKKVPIKFRFDQVEKGKKRNDLQYYDFETRKTISLYKKVQDGKTKKRHLEAFIPYPYIDPFSIINFLRSYPLKKGQKFTIPLIHKAKILKFKISVDDVLEFDSKIGKKRAFVINADSNFSGDTLKSGKITFWIADDPTRALLQARIKIKIGSIYLKLDKYQP